MARGAVRRRLDAAIQRLALDDATLTELALLRFGATALGDGGAVQLAGVLEKNTVLQVLHVPHNDITDRGVSRLAVALLKNQKLTRLNLKGNRIGPRGAIQLALSLQGNPCLTHLDLGENSLGDEGIAQIAEGVKSNHVLSHLGLQYNRVSDHGAVHFVEALNINKVLLDIDLHGNAVSEALQRQLSKMMAKNICLKARRELFWELILMLRLTIGSKLPFSVLKHGKVCVRDEAVSMQLLERLMERDSHLSQDFLQCLVFFCT